MDKSGELKVVWSAINPSGTLREYPIVADVNGDGYAELVVVSNNYAVNSLYKTDEKRGLQFKRSREFGCLNQIPRAWMLTRKVWNQHSLL